MYGQANEVRSANAKIPDTQVSRAANEVERMQKGVLSITQDLRLLADRLYGEQPQPETTGRPTAVRSGQIGSLEGQLDSLSDYISELQNQAQRLYGL